MKINKLILIIAGFILVVAGLFIVSRNRPDGLPVPSPAVQTSKWETKTDEQGPVTIKVTPLGFSLQATEWKFDVSLSTHSVELNQDMMKVAVLVDDQGRQYQPASWEGAPAGGHHREGVLIFKPIVPAPKSLQLKLSGIGDVAVRTFMWQIQ